MKRKKTWERVIVRESLCEETPSPPPKRTKDRRVRIEEPNEEIYVPVHVAPPELQSYFLSMDLELPENVVSGFLRALGDFANWIESHDGKVTRLEFGPAHGQRRGRDSSSEDEEEAPPAPVQKKSKRRRSLSHHLPRREKKMRSCGATLDPRSCLLSQDTEHL